LQEIRIGGVIRKNLPALAITFPPNFEVHGLIGMNFLKGLRFTVEMDTGTLILREARKS
jgi:predicted aspartyl protease